MTSAVPVRSIVGFLTLALIDVACGSSLTPAFDAAADVPPNACANAGCAAPPMCNVGCQATCGCCSCSPGQRSGDLLCTAEGCYVSAPLDGGIDPSWVPPAACLLPFEVGPCNAAVSVYAYVDGACAPQIYGGCQGNDNRFVTLEECLAACEGRPVPNGCPAGRVAQQICFACGPAGGCSKSATVCARTCDPTVAQACPWASCIQGVCQAGLCI